jgi:DNA-binding transcriptional MocR family regulator
MNNTFPMSTSILQTQVPAGVIDLGIGNPPQSLLPLDLLRAAAHQQLAQTDNSFLQYGLEQGDGYFRNALASFLTAEYGIAVAAESLFITSGNSNGLDLLCTLFTRPGDVIFVEEPSYFLALRIFADHGLQMIPIPTDDDGLIIDALTEKLKTYQPKFLYTIPTFQNPSGRTFSQARRMQLIEISRKHNFIIAADEVYQLLNYTAQPPTSFAAYIDSENVIAFGSFSKILAPGLRLGWLHAHPNIIQRFTGCGLLDSGGGLNPFMSHIVRGVIESGDLKQNIARLKSVYSLRLKTLDSALKQHLPQLVYSTPQGGYFLFARLPNQIDAKELRLKAKAFDVDFRPGALFSSQAGLRDHVRLGFIYYDEQEIEEGVIRLKRCLEK